MARNYFITIVAGDDYNSLIKPYNKKMDEKKIVYYYKDASKIKDNFIKVNKQILDNTEGLSDNDINIIKEDILFAQNASDEDFYFDFTAGLEYDDEYNAITDTNLDGKYSSYMIGKVFAVPFTLKNGETSFSAKKGEIDWSKMHLANQDVYASAWDMVMNHKTPETDEDKIIYENMKNRTLYFQDFGDKETYVASNTAFWGYAFLSEETGWIDAENFEQFPWMMNFYDNFIKPLSDDTLLTIIECKM